MGKPSSLFNTTRQLCLDRPQLAAIYRSPFCAREPTTLPNALAPAGRLEAANTPQAFQPKVRKGKTTHAVLPYPPSHTRDNDSSRYQQHNRQ
ncbi:hypothetical protein DP62_5730 [Burkholderia pseudomallei]|nr:hypothetical protein DP62_5730 [Burkholderia pseudomallei]